MDYYRHGYIITFRVKIIKNRVGEIFLQAKDGGEVEQSEREIKDGTSFHNIYDKLPQLCPSHEAKDLSVPIAFVALLHMCNEKVRYAIVIARAFCHPIACVYSVSYSIFILAKVT